MKFIIKSIRVERDSQRLEAGARAWQWDRNIRFTNISLNMHCADCAVYYLVRINLCSMWSTSVGCVCVCVFLCVLSLEIAGCECATAHILMHSKWCLNKLAFGRPNEWSSFFYVRFIQIEFLAIASRLDIWMFGNCLRKNFRERRSSYAKQIKLPCKRMCAASGNTIESIPLKFVYGAVAPIASLLRGRVRLCARWLQKNVDYLIDVRVGVIVECFQVGAQR